jgi:hypothetical protein
VLIPQFNRSDISDCHYTTPRNAKKKQIIVRFVSRQSVKMVYKYKKNLKLSSNPLIKGVYITDDITPFRLRLKSVVAKIHGVKTYFRVGNVLCRFKNNILC